MAEFDKLLQNMVSEVDVPLGELEKIDSEGAIRGLKLKYLDLKFRNKAQCEDLMTPVEIRGLNKSKRSLWFRFLIWSGIRSFEEIGIEQLKKLSPSQQRAYLTKKYMFYGVNPTV